MKIGERIKNRRIALEMSQEELAKKMGYKTRNAIYQFEQKDNMKLSLIEKFAEALNTTPGYLMGWEDENGDILVETVTINKKAIELYDLYENSTPDIRAAVEILLKGQSPASSDSHPKSKTDE